MLTLTYEYQIKPNRQQEKQMFFYLETCRKVYNYALAERKAWINSRSCAINACSIRHEYIMSNDAPKPSYARQCKSLAAAKKDIPELALPHTHVLQQALRTLEASFVAMWERGHGFPRFKKSGRMRSFLFPQLGVNPVQGNKLKLPKIGIVKMRLSRPIPEGFELKQVRIVKKASGWYAMLCLQLDVSVPDVMPHDHSLGIDLGLLSFLATSDNETIARPKFFVDAKLSGRKLPPGRLCAQRKLKLLQKRVSSKIKGSNNWRKAQAKVSLLHEHISNTRIDFHFKTAHHLCNQAGMIFAEDLNLKAMFRGMLCKHTLDAGFGEQVCRTEASVPATLRQFLNILEWVCSKRDVYFAKVDANFTSQTCPNCQTHTGKKDLSERVHSCPSCGYKTERDVAAAQIVMQRGIAAASFGRSPSAQKCLESWGGRFTVCPKLSKRVAVGHTVLKLSEGKDISLPMKKESPSEAKTSAARLA